MTEVHHDLALVLDVVDRLLQRRELGVGEIEGDADDRLPVGAGPFVAEVAGRVEAAEPLRRQLAVELGDVLLEHRPLELQAEVLDLHLEEATRLRRRLLERMHGAHGTGFEHLVAPRVWSGSRPSDIGISLRRARDLKDGAAGKRRQNLCRLAAGVSAWAILPAP